MIQNVSSAAAVAAAPIKSPANPKAAPQEVSPAAAVARAPSAAELNAKAFLQRQQIGAALYDRSFTFKEGVAALKRQDAIAAYAEKIQGQAGGATERDLRILDRKLDRADTQIAKLANNTRGADLDSLEAIDGKELDTVQENLMNRINAGIKDGSLTEDEAKGLLTRMEDLNKVEAKLRESDGKLTSGEQKQMLDQLRKEADKVNSLRHNNTGTNLTYKSYSDSIDNRQAALAKELERGIARGSLTEKEVEKVKESFAQAQAVEDELRTDGRVDWKDSMKMSTALNDVEIALYDLQRNKQGTQLADSYVDVKHADLRQAQMLENTARGISNKALTDDEGIELLNAQQKVQNSENHYMKDDGKLDRGEYLRLQSQMNDFSLRNHELQNNKDRWTGIMKEPAVVQTPVKPLPPVSVSDGPKTPVVEIKPEIAVCGGPMVAVCEMPVGQVSVGGPVVATVAAEPVAPPAASATGQAKVEWNAGNALTMQAYDAKADKWVDIASKGRGENPAFNTTVTLSQDVLDGGRFRIVDGGTVLENGRKSTNADGSVTIRFNDTGADQDFNDALITFKPSTPAESASAPVSPPAAPAITPAAPAITPAVDPAVAPAAKPEVAQSAPPLEFEVAKPAPAPAPIQVRVRPLEDKFGAMLSGMMDSVNKGNSNFHKEVNERREEHEDRGNHFGEAKKFGDSKKEDVKAVDHRFAAYAKADAGKGHSEGLRKSA